MNADACHDVAIVGCGPTGAVLANLLGMAGLDVVVLEREPDVFALPRAAHFDGETMRVFQSIGLKDAARAISRPGNKGMHFLSASGQTLLVRRGIDQPGPHGDFDNWYFHQPELERALRAGLARFPRVGVRLRQEVVAVDDGPERACLRVRDLASGDERVLNARYVVGCDGARSLVRRAIGGRSEDLGLHQPWLCLDLIMAREVGLPEYTVQLCDPARPMTLVNMAGRRRRWEIMLMPGDDPLTIARPESVWPLLARWVTPADARIERAAVYTFHSVVAIGWRRGRLLIAGDAAHQTPPFLGQGMCAGVRDAANLAWKLALVLGGRAGEGLLDTYESERGPHVRTFIELAVKVGDVIQATDLAVAAERDRRFAESGPEIFGFPVPQLGPGAHDGGEPPVGSVFPQPRLDDGRLLDDAIGPGYALLVARAARNDVREDSRSAIRLKGVAFLDDVGAGVSAWLAERGALAVLLRPDRYVAGLARDAAEIDVLLQRVPGVAGVVRHD